MRGLAAFALLATLLAGAGLAAAHAVPAQTSPGPGQRLAEAPTEVWVVFTETPDPARTELSVLDASLQRVDAGGVAVQGLRASLALPGGLPPGGYLVKWSTLSAADGHTTRGSWGFAVGEAAAPQGGVESVGPTPAGVAGKAGIYLGLVIGGGAVGFDLLVGAARGRAWWSRYLLAGASVHLAGLALFTMAQAGDAWPGAYIVGTAYGQGLAWRLLAAILLLGLAALPPEQQRRQWSIAVAGLIAIVILLQGSYSHTAGYLGGPLGGALDAAHLATVSLWTGGLGALLLLLLALARGEAEGYDLPRIASRFSTLATACVVLVAGVGLVMFFVLEGLSPAGWFAALATPYGALLGLKIGLFVPMLALGAVNRFVHVRGLQRGGPDAARDARAFRGNVLREVAVGVLVLALAAAATSYSPPPPGAAYGPGPSPAPPLVLNTSAEHFRFGVTIAPPPRAAADANVTVQVRDLDGGPDADALRLVLVFEPTGEDVGRTEVIAQHRGNGTFEAGGSFFSLPGEWKLTLRYRSARVFEETASLTFTVTPAQ